MRSVYFFIKRFTQSVFITWTIIIFTYKTIRGEWEGEHVPTSIEIAIRKILNSDLVSVEENAPGKITMLILKKGVKDLAEAIPATFEDRISAMELYNKLNLRYEEKTLETETVTGTSEG